MIRICYVHCSRLNSNRELNIADRLYGIVFLRPSIVVWFKIIIISAGSFLDFTQLIVRMTALIRVLVQW